MSITHQEDSTLSCLTDAAAFTQVLSYAEEIAQAPFGEPIFLFKNIYLVRLPLPNNPLKALNSYVILDDDGTTTLIDVGFNHPDCERAVNNALETLGRSWDKVNVILTHSHADHTGNLDRILRPTMKIYAHMHSFQEVKNLNALEGHVYGPLLSLAATPEQEVEITYNVAGHPQFVTTEELLPLKSYPDFTYVKEGDVIEAGGYSFQVVETPGHDEWHMCLYEPTHRFMIVGDHVLERITPLVMSWFPALNTLEDFLNSLRKIATYDVELILPAHGKPYTGLAERVEFLLAHHAARLEEIYSLVAAGHSSILDITAHCTWRYPNWNEWDLQQKFFSMGETLAHLIYLVRQGKIQQHICGWEYHFSLPHQCPLCSEFTFMREVAE
jgi:glyoxylase-like metal-dependent hydrolase (beta-lactamase superfamily II)